MSSSGPPEAVSEQAESIPAAAVIPGPRREISAEELGAPPPLPRRWGFGAYLLAEGVFLGSSVLLVLPYVGEGGGHPPAWVLLLGLSVPTILAAGIAVLATIVRGNGPRIDLGLRFERSDLGRGLLFGGAGLLVTIPAAAIWAQVVGTEGASSAVAELFAGQRFGLPMAIGVFLVVWLLAPVCEEIVYRGLLWRAMERHGANRWWAFGLTTLCFALAHFEFTRTPLLLVIALPIGLARLYTGRIGASIVAHQLNNLLPAVALLLVLLGVIG